jgi:hypothetical protein
MEIFSIQHFNRHIVSLFIATVAVLIFGIGLIAHILVTNAYGQNQTNMTAAADAAYTAAGLGLAIECQKPDINKEIQPYCEFKLPDYPQTMTINECTYFHQGYTQYLLHKLL